jgi:aminoglycoside 6'-N-acetyltransferase
MAARYRFRSFTRADLPMAARWLSTPDVVRWWGDPTRELTLLAGDLDEPLMRQWIVEYDKRPFAYVQAYPTDAWPQPHFTELPPGAVAIDCFVGVPDMIGRGHGSAFLRVFAQMLIDEGAPVVAIDPSADNRRARRANARAGFVGDVVSNSESGPVVVMLFPSAG